MNKIPLFQSISKYLNQLKMSHIQTKRVANQVQFCKYMFCLSFLVLCLLLNNWSTRCSNEMITLCKHNQIFGTQPNWWLKKLGPSNVGSTQTQILNHSTGRHGCEVRAWTYVRIKESLGLWRQHRYNDCLVHKRSFVSCHAWWRLQWLPNRGS